MSLEVLVNTYVVEDDNIVLQELAHKLVETGSLLSIVRCLESPLTQEDSLVRAKATQCLADVVNEHNSLNKQELTVLSIFLLNRLQDKDSISAAARGLRSLIAKPGFKLADINEHDFWKRLKDIDMLNIDLNTRYEVFLLLKELAKTPNTEFVATYVALAGGEKDPRNLLLNLQTTRLILNEVASSLPSEILSELYDITFCYFPIKFHPPNDMPYKVTAEELRNSLHKTLSNPAIAEWVIPGLVSKLTAVNINVKIDALTSLNDTLENLKSSGGLEPYWLRIWDGIKFEVLHGTPESETYAPVVKILQKFVVFDEFLAEVLKELEPENISQAKLIQICHLIVGIAKTEEAWKALTPKALEKCQEFPKAINLFLDSGFPLPHQDQVFQALLTALANGEKRESLRGLTKFAQTPDTAEYIPLIIQTLTTESAYSSLAELAPSCSQDLQNYCLPQLLTQLPDSLDSLGQICCVRSLVHTLTVRLMSRFSFTEQIGTGEGKPKFDYPLKLLETLIVATGHLKEPSEFIGYDRVLVPVLFEKYKDAHQQSIQIDESVTNAACILLERAARGVRPDHQSAFATDVIRSVDTLHFHLILSCVAPLEKYPFRSDFVESAVIPRLSMTSKIMERAAYLRLIALIANKWPTENSSGIDVQAFSESQKAALVANERDANAIEVFIWLTKGLISRSDSLGFANAAFLTEKAPTNVLISKAYGALVTDDRIVAKENGCKIRPLFKQRLFVSSLPVLSQNSHKKEALTALISLLKFTPHSVLVGHFSQILPMLVSSLKTESTILQETALHAINSSLPETASLLEPELSNLITVFIELANTARSSNARVLALKSLISLRDALPEKTAGFNAQVLDGVEPVLGDKKREVRKHAVKCRQLFH